jgi:hypothetical protein
MRLPLYRSCIAYVCENICLQLVIFTFQIRKLDESEFRNAFARSYIRVWVSSVYLQY